jgi:hypothetical protein
MNESLLICDNFQYNIDLAFYEKNNKIFEDNQENFYKIINSTNLSHHLFLEEIFKNTNI